MKTNAMPRHRKASGFTLIELLVVIVIIATLAGLSFGGFTAVKRQGEKTRAKNDATQLAMAIEAYFNEYNVYPLDRNGNDEELETDAEFMAKLMGFDKEANPRGMVFIEPKEAGKARKGGMISEGGGPGDYVDPWGELYMVKLDGNYDNKVENPDPNGESQELFQRVLVWSRGFDRDTAAQSKGGDLWKDNVATWK